MPRTRCPHCQAVESFEESERGLTRPCASCEKSYRVPGGPKGAAAPSAPAPKATTAGRKAAKPRPPDEEDVAELDEVTDAADEDDADGQEEEEEDRPRRKKRRRRRPAGGFSLVDSIPMDYVSQSNIAVGIGLFLYFAVGGANRMGSDCLSFVLLLLTEVCFVWGCAAYARYKGYSEWFGFLGLLGCLGMLVLVCLPRRAES